MATSNSIWGSVASGSSACKSSGVVIFSSAWISLDLSLHNNTVVTWGEEGP